MQGRTWVGVVLSNRSGAPLYSLLRLRDCGDRHTKQVLFPTPNYGRNHKPYL